MLPLAIVGARAHYVIFEWDYYSKNLGEVIDIRGSGLTIYGGIVATATTCYVICRKRNLKFLKMLSIFIPAIVLGQLTDGWGNFTNKEACGTPVSLPWATIIDSTKIHPALLYESLGDSLIFLLPAYVFRNRRKFNGQVTSLYMIFYRILRFFVEGPRTNNLYIGTLRMS